MKFVKDNILFIAVVLFVLWLYFFTKPTNVNIPLDTSKFKKVITVTDTIYTTKKSTIYKKGADISHTDTLYLIDTIYDTIRIVQDYNIVRAYNDTIKVDSSTFVISDSISHNKILNRKFEANIATKTIVSKEYYTQKNYNTLYLGIRGDLRAPYELMTLSPSLMLSVKNKALIGLSVNISKNYNIGYSGSIYFKISK